MYKLVALPHFRHMNNKPCENFSFSTLQLNHLTLFTIYLFFRILHNRKMYLNYS